MRVPVPHNIKSPCSFFICFFLGSEELGPMALRSRSFKAQIARRTGPTATTSCRTSSYGQLPF